MTNSIHDPVEELIHGVLVRDPYRWLEDRDLPETGEWIHDQHRRCQEYFAGCSELDGLRNRVREYLDIEVVDQPTKVAGRYFYRRRNQGQEQASIYVRDIASRLERLLVDPAPMGPFTSVGIHRISEDGSLLAFELKHGGEDRKAIHIVDVESGNILPDRIETGYARGFVFTADRRGFLYCHETSASQDEHVVALHLFHDPGEDQIVFREVRSRESRLVLIADNVHLGIIRIHQRPESSELVADFYIAKMDDSRTWKKIIGDRASPYSPILKHGRILAISYERASNGKLVELNTAGCEIRTIVAEQKAMLRQFVITKNRIFGSYLLDLVPSILWWALSGTDAGMIELPPDGTIQLVANQSEEESDLFYTYESFVQPPEIFEFVPDTEASRIWYRPLLPAINRGTYSLRRVSVETKDRTKIPMMLVGEDSVGRGPEQPVIMTGYGGFGVAMTPRYSLLVSIMLEQGAIFALPQIRGGGEFGRDWHEAARARNRQTAFDDFTAVAEWLCLRGETNRSKLGIFGGSNSGLLVGVAMTQRPELFHAVLCIAPLLDMVRYERFDQAARWIGEYGSIENEEEFKALYAYSPYHQVRDSVDYPAVLFVSGDEDDRCNPAHVRKMAALLQQRSIQTRPVLVDYTHERGHAPVLPLSVRVEALVRRIAFLGRELSIPIAFGGSHETANS